MALSATEAINREVFESLSLAPDRLSLLCEILAELRAEAGDF